MPRVPGLVLLLSVALIVAGAVLVPAYADSVSPHQSLPRPTFIPPPTQTPNVHVQVWAIATQSPANPGEPVNLLIPRLGLEAEIQPVSLTADNAMDVPADGDKVGWFESGARPGEAGNAVLAGHLTTGYGLAGVFWGLSRLWLEDKLYVEDDRGHTFQFRVTHSQTFEAKDFPTTTIFGPGTGAHLNLITCEGAWSWQGFSQRLVIFAELVP
jgi:hypothetical protein